MPVVIVSKLLNLWWWLSHCHSAFPLFKELTIKGNKIACQSAGKQFGDGEEPGNTNGCVFVWVRGFSLVEWRGGNEASVKSILKWKFSVDEGVLFACAETHISLRKGLNCTPEGGDPRLWCSYLCRTRCPRTFPSSGRSSPGSGDQCIPGLGESGLMF